MKPTDISTDAARQIDGFIVYETEAGWLAVHEDDDTIKVQAPDWDGLYLCCRAQSIAIALRQGSVELGNWWMPNDRRVHWRHTLRQFAGELADWGRWDQNEPRPGR